MRHLTEEEIQTYLDAAGEGLSAELRQHLGTCSLCRKVFEEYRTLYTSLADETAFQAPPDLTRSVISGLGLEPARRRLRIPGDSILVASGIFAMLVAVAIFADLSPLRDPTSAAGSRIIEYVSPHLGAVRDRLSDADRITTVLMTGAAAFALMGALDALFKWRRAAYPAGPAR